jgi:uncharacterized membrane protein YgdD (TMEM256/DUF423 family)
MIGAFGSHLLKQYLTPDLLATFQTGVNYQFFHTLALLITGFLLKRYPNDKIMWAGRFFMLGIIFFSGSLYLLVLVKAMKGIDLGLFSLLTPLGGLLFMAGWISLMLGVPSSRHLGED